MAQEWKMQCIMIINNNIYHFAKANSEGWLLSKDIGEL